MNANLMKKHNDKEKPRKRSAFRHSKNSKGMMLLYRASTMIQTGKYAGMTFGSVLKLYGKKALPELLKYYRISSTIMDKYHCTLKPHDNKSLADVPIQDKALAQEKSLVATEASVSVTKPIAKVAKGTDALDTANRVEIDDHHWTSSRSDYENNVLYDPEDDMPDWNPFMGNDGHLSYWDEAS